MGQADDFAVYMNPSNPNAEQVRNWISEHMDARTDPASKVPGAAPLYGNDAVPHLLTYSSVVGSFSRAYLNPDEAIRDSLDNAHLMEKDVGILECIDARRRLTALLDWEIKPEDEKCQYQVSLAQELQRIISRIKNFTEYRMWLMRAIWSGRSGIQHKYGYTRVNGKMRMMPTPLHRDHQGWTPINGDKLVFRYEDVNNYTDKDAYPHQMGIRVGTVAGNRKMRLHREYNLEPVADGMALFLKPYERDTFVVHKHYIEDADFHHAYFAGSLHGVGIRSKIYWEWFLKQEALAFLMQYLERSAGGVEIWTYPMGDPNGLAKVKAASQERMANGRNIVYFPKPMGDDSDVYKFEVVEPGAMGLDIIQSIVENYFGGRLKRYILGQELSTEAKSTGLGSSVAEAHMDTLSQIVHFDAAKLEETLTYELVRFIQQLNFPETMGWFMKFSLKTKDEKVQDRLDALNAAYQMGASIPESEVFKTLGLSAPTSGQKVLSMSSQQQPMPGGMPPGAGIPDGDATGAEPAADAPNSPDGENDPMSLIAGMMDQYSMANMPADDTQDRASIIAEILTHFYGPDVERIFPEKYAKAWDEKLHPRHEAGKSEGGRFRKLMDDDAHAAAKSQIGLILQGTRTPETAKQLSGILMGMSVAQLNELKKEYGVKASGVKASLVDKIAQRLAGGQTGGGRVAPTQQAPAAQQKSLFPEDGQIPDQENDPKQEKIEKTPAEQSDLPSVETVPEPPAPAPQMPQAVPADNPNADMPVKPVRRRMAGGNADSMKAQTIPSAARVTPKPDPAPQAAPPQETPPLEEMARIAAGYQLHGMRAEPEDNRLARQHQKHMTKSALDSWLMKKFNIDSFTARGVSNAAGEMNPYTVEGSGTVGGTRVRWTHKAKEPSLEEIGNTPWMTKTVPEPTSQPAPASRVTPRPADPTPQATSGDMSQTPQASDTSAKPVDSGDTSPEQANDKPAALTPEQSQLVTDNFHLVQKTVRMMQKQGWATRDSDQAESAAMDGLMKAARKYDGTGDFATFAKNGMAQEIKNLNRRKADKMTQNESVDDDGQSSMASVASGERSSGDFRADATSKLDEALSAIPNDDMRWLVKAWFSNAIDNQKASQEEIAAAYNQRTGKSVSRQRVGQLASDAMSELRGRVKEDDYRYSIIKAWIERYYRNELAEQQKERYERRQDRMIREAAEYTETDPSDAQIEAGNYRKGRFNWNGLQFVIENPRGSTRRGVSRTGRIWKTEMKAHYGYLTGTHGADGDQVDCFMGRCPESEIVFVVRQIDQSTGQFDEHKCVLGCTNEKQAKDLYLSHYSSGWKCGPIDCMTVDQFKERLESGDL